MATRKPNRAKLRKKMEENNLKPQDVATILDRKLSTVQTWLTTSGVDIPEHQLALLHYRLEEKKIDNE